MISIEIKQQCLRMKSEGIMPRDIYNDYFTKSCDSEMGFESFRRKMNQWKKYLKITDKIIEGASLHGMFKPEWGTVKTDGKGNIETVWLRTGKPEDKVAQEFLSVIKELKPIEIIESLPDGEAEIKTMLEIALFDMHFGVNYYEDYENHLNKIRRAIRRKHDQIIITVGSDMLHHNDMQNKTVSGTLIEQVKIRKAHADALKFYINLINEAVDSKAKVNVIYVKGNHDESPSWYFVQTLKQIFPTVIFDDDFKERKHFKWEQIFIGFIHGDKPIANIDRVFAKEFRKELADVEIFEIHIGHTHREVAKGNTQDITGTMVRVLSTSAKTDEWHDDNNYVGANKRFQLFEYSSDELINAPYISGK